MKEVAVSLTFVVQKNADDDKFAAGSDSDGEVKSKQKKNNKKKNKKKKRPEPPTAPPPLQADGEKLQCDHTYFDIKAHYQCCALSLNMTSYLKSLFHKIT